MAPLYTHPRLYGTAVTRQGCARFECSGDIGKGFHWITIASLRASLAFFSAFLKGTD
jgi:hypothetical protein